jgi:hypothetical protein
MGTKVKNRIKKTLKDLTEEDKVTIGRKLTSAHILLQKSAEIFFKRHMPAVSSDRPGNSRREKSPVFILPRK